MKVRVNCPIAGCGTRVQVQNLTKHLEGVHDLEGEIQLRLHPTSPYTQQPELAAEPEPEPEKEPETEPEPEKEPETEPEPEKEPETEPEE
ncbi:hypothetical protein ES705_15294 [subsurface metagenome]